MRTNVTILLTSGRSVIGSFDHGEQRLSDALNGSLASVLRIADARLGRFGNPAANEPVAVAVVPKNHAALVIPNAEVRRPATDKGVYSYVAKQTSELLVLLAGLRIRGSAHGAAYLDEVALHRQLSESADRFIVLTDAWLAFDIEGTTERSVGVAMLNSRHIQFVAKAPAAAAGTGPRGQTMLASTA
jgi:hypothetical protein